jgi:outer membrane protein assembly factor BamE (lipoprotein component of BamABCDE complex)
MLRKVFIIILLAILGSFNLSGCDKTSSDSESEGDVVVKTQAEYDAEAEAQITEENMEEELKKLEQAIDKEITEEP